ncbi:hypothetical protein SERLA73DRAFT_44393, partial [Serpula lacrymans var. lacrymans S7.3]
DQSLATPKQYDKMRNNPYQKAVGCLIWIPLGLRPDIAFTTKILAQLNQNPGKLH